MGYGYDYPAAKIINDTAAHTGRFGKVVALNDAVINTLVAENVTGDLTGISVSASAEVCGVITSVKLDSGSMIAYSL
mgnify:CR=1 FL=1|tara:strand:+ start:257 stop:487 length:231 start_codon:yes stop_codon:yes gene_type:complete